jgi:Tol biopolymer transport system component
MDAGGGGGYVVSSPRAVSGRRHRPGTRLPGRGARVLLAIVLTTVAALVLAPTAANAAFPGANGLIVFASSRLGFARWCPSRHEGDQLFALLAGGSGPFQLTCNPGIDQHPFVSPDGSEVVFTNIVGGRQSRLFTIPLPSSPLRRPQHPTLVSDSPHASDDYASWSPTGNGTVVFQRTDPGANSQLYIENVSSSSSAAPVFPTPTGYNDTEPVFDPSDPEMVAFVRHVGMHSHIFSYDLASHVLTDLSAQGDGGTSGNDSKPDFAATGESGRIVFQSDRLCNRMQLYTMTPQGTGQAPVFQTSRHRGIAAPRPCPDASEDPAYSPEGDALTFDNRARDGAIEVFTVSVDSSGRATGSSTRIPTRWAVSGQPNWGPATDPPVQTPETGFAIVLPVVGVGIILAFLVFYRRRQHQAPMPRSQGTGRVEFP